MRASDSKIGRASERDATFSAIALGSAIDAKDESFWGVVGGVRRAWSLGREFSVERGDDGGEAKDEGREGFSLYTFDQRPDPRS